VRRIHQGGGSLEGVGRAAAGEGVGSGCEGIDAADVCVIVMASSEVDFESCRA
jgi:hypothetical protein